MPASTLARRLRRPIAQQRQHQAPHVAGGRRKRARPGSGRCSCSPLAPAIAGPAIAARERRPNPVAAADAPCSRSSSVDRTRGRRDTGRRSDRSELRSPARPTRCCSSSSCIPAGRHHLRRADAPQVIRQGHQVGGVGVAAGESLAEAGDVRQQLMRGDAVSRLHVRHVGADVPLQIELAGVHQLQRRDAGRRASSPSRCERACARGPRARRDSAATGRNRAA